MTGIDWILLAILAISLLLGAWRGLVYEVLSVLAWVAAFFVAYLFAPDIAGHLPLGDIGDPIHFAAAFVLLFILVAFVGGLLAALIKKAVTAVGLRPVDRALGMVFGIARAAIILLAIAVVARLVPALGTSPAWRQSIGAPYLIAGLESVTPMLPERFARIIQ